MQSIYHPSERGETPLICAAICLEERMGKQAVELLVRAGADISVVIQGIRL